MHDLATALARALKGARRAQPRTPRNDLSDHNRGVDWAARAVSVELARAEFQFDRAKFLADAGGDDMSKYCSLHADDNPGVRAECAHWLSSGKDCVNCPNRDIRAEVKDLRAEVRRAAKDHAIARMYGSVYAERK